MAFQLVHGAGRGAPCWDRWVPTLDGPTVLPGRRKRFDRDVRSGDTRRLCRDDSADRPPDLQVRPAETRAGGTRFLESGPMATVSVRHERWLSSSIKVRDSAFH